MDDPSKYAVEINAQLEQMLSHSLFRSAKRSCSFLRYVTSQVLAGQSYQIKEFSIAVDAFGLETTFDQQVDPRIRVEAKRLRDRLDQYYKGPGVNDMITISMEKGSYIPSFSLRSKGNNGLDVDDQDSQLEILIDGRFLLRPVFHFNDLKTRHAEGLRKFKAHFIHLLFDQSKIETSSCSLPDIIRMQSNAYSIVLDYNLLEDGNSLNLILRYKLAQTGTLIGDHLQQSKDESFQDNDSCRVLAQTVVQEVLSFCRSLQS